jgi:primosomal protein N'
MAEQLTTLRGVVDVLVDGAPARLGSLSYFLPDGVEVVGGQAVTVPFGKRTTHGMVLGPGDATRATREVHRVWGTRLHPADLAVMHTLAARYLTSVAALARRAAPGDGKGAAPLDAGDVVLAGGPVEVASAADRYLLRPPLTDPAALAASAAALVADGGQVLVLCPTRRLAEAVAGCFSSGAAVLDAPGAWPGFVAGSVQIGVGTRAAALWSPRNLAGFVVVEEDHPGHVEAAQPRTNARDIAVARARARGVPVCLTGCTPTGAGLGAGVKVIRGGPVADIPSVTVVAASGRALPTRARLHIARALAAGLRVAVACSTRTVRLRCPQCKTERMSSDRKCSRCGSTDVVRSGWDAERVTSELGDAVEALPPGRAPRRPADLVVVLGADGAAARAGFTPEADVARRVLDCAQWCSPGGRVIAVAVEPDNPVLQRLADGDQRSAARLVWERAKADGLPPYGRVVEVAVARRSVPSTAGWPGRVFGPRATGEGEWVVLVRCSDAELAHLHTRIEQLRRTAKVRVTVS